MNKTITSCKTCATCWHLFTEPFTDVNGDVYTGCGNDREFIVRSDPETFRILESRPITADDEACEDYITQQEGDDEQAQWNAMSEAERSQANAQKSAEVKIQLAMAQASYAFKTAMDEVLRLQNLHGDDHKLVFTAFMQAFELAPEGLKSVMREEMNKLGLFPKACGYTDNGDPVFSLEDAAAQLGVTTDQAKASIEKFMAERREAGLEIDSLMVDPAKIHRIH